MSHFALIAISWKNLVNDRLRTLVSLVGVTFAVLLMLLQSAIYLGFVGSASSVIDHCSADLWIVKAATLNFESAPAFHERAVHRVRGVPGIEWAENLIYSFGQLKLPGGATQWAHVVGFDPRHGVGGPWKMERGSTQALMRSGTMIVDASSLGRFQGSQLGDRLENFQQNMKIVGISRGTRSCTPNPVVFTSFKTAQKQIPLFQGQTNFIVAKFAKGADREAVLERLRRMRQFDVLSRDEFSRKTQHYWATKTGIGIGNGVTIILGFIVGLVILGQTMYSATMDRLEEFAALKIMGATNLQICVIIWTQALLMAAGGYMIGVLSGSLLTNLYQDQVVSMHISGWLLVLLGFGTVLMCLAASMLSIARVLRVSPAALFRV